MSTSSNEEKHRQQVFAAMEETEKLQVNKQHLIGLYEVLLKWRCSGPGGTPRTFK